MCSCSCRANKLHRFECLLSEYQLCAHSSFKHSSERVTRGKSFVTTRRQSMIFHLVTTLRSCHQRAPTGLSFNTLKLYLRNELSREGNPVCPAFQVALIFAQPRGATVKAVGQLQLLSLDRRTFKRVMGPMENILKRNMKTYKRIAASNI